MNDKQKEVSQLHLDTIVVHSGYERKSVRGALSPPIWMASTYANEDPTELGAYYYSRCDNPSRKAFESAVRDLERGTDAIAFSSGTAACTAVLSMIQPGDLIVSSDDLYAGTLECFRVRPGVECRKFSSVDDLAAVLADVPTDRNVMIWLETPSNPTMKVFDIRAIVRSVNQRQATVVVDNTFLTGALQRPLLLGADVVMASASKALSGHSDIIMGVTICRDSDIAAKLRRAQISDGATPSPFDCFLALRGMRTLALRVRRQSENGMLVAETLNKHPAIRAVLYPGLEAHPGHAIARSQTDGFGGMVSFYVRGGKSAALSFMKGCKLIAAAVSLGGVESVVQHPKTMTHRSLDPSSMEDVGITDELLRFSAGIEAGEDIVDDILQALKNNQELK